MGDKCVSLLSLSCRGEDKWWKYGRDALEQLGEVRATGSFTRLERLALSQQGFDSRVSAQWDQQVEILFIACMEKGERESVRTSSFLASLCIPFPPENQCSKNLQSKQRLHKSQFLQKQSCQKPYWDQARLSSLANKKNDVRGAPRVIGKESIYGLIADRKQTKI